MLTTYKFNYMVIIPKQSMDTGIVDIDAFTYWGAYWKARRMVKGNYPDDIGVNVFIKRHQIEI
jgi:hypothetical protein